MITHFKFPFDRGEKASKIVIFFRTIKEFS